MARKDAGATNPTDSGWDTEDRKELVSVAEGHLKGRTMYVTALLWSRMRDSWGGVVTHIKTRTDPATGEVRVFKAEPDEAGAVLVRRSNAPNAAEFSFFRPLRKLGIEVPKDRMFIFTPVAEEMAGVGTVYVFPMANAESVPRKVREAAPGKMEQ